KDNNIDKITEAQNNLPEATTDQNHISTYDLPESEERRTRSTRKQNDRPGGQCKDHGDYETQNHHNSKMQGSMASKKSKSLAI
ncbi:hypothetical protein M8C21_029812, partial [Ambrosia artemisiifolia]